MDILRSDPPCVGQSPPTDSRYDGVWRFTAPVADTSVPLARHTVRDLLRRRVVVSDERRQDVLLIVSELVTNVVQHAALLSTEIAVEVALGPQWLRIGVEDGHPYRPTALRTDVGRVGGRGLSLVGAILRQAGGEFDVLRTAGGGKVVLAALPLAPTSRHSPR